VVKSAPNDVTSLAYLGETPYIAFESGSGRSADVELAHRSAGKWVIEVVDKAAARYTSLAFDIDESPVVAYSDDANHDGQLDTLKIARKTTSGWQVTVVETGTVGYGVFASLAFDAGKPAIVHNNTAVRYAAWTGDWASQTGTWSTSIVDPGPFAKGECLRFSTSGPVVSLHQTLGNGFPDTLKVATGTLTDGTMSWALEPIASVASPEDFGFRTSLALDASGQPSVSADFDLARDLKYFHQMP